MDASRLIIELTARHTAALLADDSRKYAIDTMLAATTLTSDLEDLVTLCSGIIATIKT